MMPENWQPGQNIRLPDPSDPMGRTFIEIPADQVEVVAKIASPRAQQQQVLDPGHRTMPNFGAEIGPTKLETEVIDAARPPRAKKKKKKKVKKQVVPEEVPDSSLELAEREIQQ